MVNLLDKIGLPANRLKFFKKDSLKILFVASEARPFIKIGGLGEVMHALPESLRQLGHDARIIIPKYATIEAEKFSFELVLKGIKPESDENDPHGIFISNILNPSASLFLKELVTPNGSSNILMEIIILSL